MSFLRRHFLAFLIFPVLLNTALPAVCGELRRDRFKWMSVQTAHFDIYYDKSTEALVPRMAHYLESAWQDVGSLYDFYVPERTPFFFYSNHNEFEQTNIVDIGEGTGGVTEAFKNRFLVFNDGSEEWLRHVIYHEFAHVVQFNILYGGFWKSIRLLKSPFYPLWMMEGTAEFGSGDIDDATGDMVVRDAFAHKQLPALAELQGFSHLKPNQVTLGYKTGDAAIEFLKDEYGREKLHDFLFAMKDYFDVSSALQATLGDPVLGCDLERFNFRFHEWLEDKYAAHLREAKAPDVYGPRLTTADALPQFNEAPVPSPDGKKVYFFSDRGGPTQVFELDVESGRSKPLIALNNLTYENLQTRGRALSISPDGRWLAFSGEKKQRDLLYLFDLKRGKLKRLAIPFDEMRTPAFSPLDSNRLVCVGMKRGYNDIYIIDRKAHVVERLTDSPQDERDPVFSPDGGRVYYSGEVVAGEKMDPVGRDIFYLDVKTKEISHLTQHKGNELEPEPLPDGGLLYVRDRDDAERYGFNIIHREASGAETKLTHMIGGAFSPRYSSAGASTFYVGFNAGEKHIYKATWTFDTSMGAFEEARKAPDPRQASLNWPLNNGSPLFSTVGRPYRFKASTDLFIPFFFYSSVDGFVLMDIWQFSDMLGNHQFQQQAQFASNGDTMDLSAIYTYARYRPTFSFGARSLRFYRDFDEDSQRREISGFAYATYPLNRVSAASVGAGVTNRDDVFLDDSEPDTRFRDRYLIGSLQYNSITGRYLVPTKGHRAAFVYQQGYPEAGGDQRYKSGFVEGVKYIPIPRESTVATRLFMGRSIGEERQVFRLGGVDRIRALPSNSESNKKTNVAVASAELRLRIKYLNARTAFLFPDFFFKAAYLVVFNDAGYGWDNTEEREAFDASKIDNATGIGISWPTFILQTFQLNLTVQYAHRTNTGSDVWYISAGPSF